MRIRTIELVRGRPGWVCCLGFEAADGLYYAEARGRWPLPLLVWTWLRAERAWFAPRNAA